MRVIRSDYLRSEFKFLLALHLHIILAKYEESTFVDHTIQCIYLVHVKMFSNDSKTTQIKYVMKIMNLADCRFQIVN